MHATKHDSLILHLFGCMHFFFFSSSKRERETEAEIIVVAKVVYRNQSENYCNWSDALSSRLPELY